MLLKSFLPKAKSIAIPIKHFDYCLAAIAENKEMSREGIEFQDSLY